MHKIPPELGHLSLAAHPEGGFYRETYRSEHLSTIDYVLLGRQFSGWHRVAGRDEVWNHHQGGRLALHLIDPNGVYSSVELGRTLHSAVVPADWWQAAEALDDAWVHTGCTVAAPFTFDAFTMADDSLFDTYPHLSAHERLLRRA